MTVTTLPTPLTAPVVVPPAAEQTAGPRDLTPEQVATLLAPINPSRVQTLNRQSHVEAWDVRRWLTRTFGFGGWSVETLELACVAQIEINPGRWTVVYRAQVRLTVRTPDGRTLSSWEDGASGDAPNQKAIGDAHDMAMKTALSQALKRCAVNLGDGFGLSLYNDGSRRAVVQWSAVHTAPKDPEKAAAEDEPVKPEPTPEQPAVEQPAASPAEQAPAAEQQPRRSNRAARQTRRPAQQQEPPAAEQAPPVSGYITKAKAAKTAADVRVLYDAAKAEGLALAVLAQLADIGAAKPGAKPRRKSAPTPASTPTSPPQQDDEHAMAVGEVIDAARGAGITDRAEVDALFASRFGCALTEAALAQLREMRDDLIDAAEEPAA
ncbi:ssDNA binding protein [Streptomyces phage SV1]|uniref:DNA repair protein n=1 Tax=Streptomyces phage SV1 TaxID=1204525 RepID=UPI00028AD95A|nr:DNA repair protein [Streptomyces phage SV1]AFU62174.1 ssDNA binding protein [Streptomyces phage SV1]